MDMTAMVVANPGIEERQFYTTRVNGMSSRFFGRQNGWPSSWASGCSSVRAR